MRHLIAIAAFAAFPIHVHAETPVEAVAAFHAALANRDRAKAGAMLSPNIEIYESGYVERSRDEYEAHHLGSDMQYAHATTTRVLRQSERIAGNLAIVLRETETKGSYEGRAVHQVGTETTVLERDGDRWVIAHVHWSSRKGK